MASEYASSASSFFVPAITCNDFVFVAGQMASDENALDPSVKLPKEVRNWGGPNAIRRQTEFVIKKRLEPALKAAGSTWKDILKAQIYVPTAADIPDALDVWHQHVGAHLRPPFDEQRRAARQPAGCRTRQRACRRGRAAAVIMRSAHRRGRGQSP